MGHCMEGMERDWFIYKIMSQDMSTELWSFINKLFYL